MSNDITTQQNTEPSPPPVTNRIERDASDPSRVRINAELEYSQKDYTDKHRPHTRGEKWFDRIVHFCLDFVVNGAASIAFTHWVSTKHEEKYNQAKNWMFDATNKAGDMIGMKPSEEKTRKFSDYFTDLFTLSMVGHFLLIPIKILKDKEAKIVRWIDKKLDWNRPISEKEKIYREIAYTAIEQKPKQTIGRVILSRIGALALNWGTMWGINNKLLSWDKFKATHKDIKGYTNAISDRLITKFMPGLFDVDINRSSKVISNGITQNIKHYTDLKTKSPENLDPQMEKAIFSRSIIKLTAYEILSCAITAIGLKKVMTGIEKLVGYRSERKKKKEEKSATALANTDAPETSTKEPAASEKEHTPQPKKPYTEQLQENAALDGMALSY